MWWSNNCLKLTSQIFCSVALNKGDKSLKEPIREKRRFVRRLLDLGVWLDASHFEEEDQMSLEKGPRAWAQTNVRVPLSINNFKPIMWHCCRCFLHGYRWYSIKRCPRGPKKHWKHWQNKVKTHVRLAIFGRFFRLQVKQMFGEKIFWSELNTLCECSATYMRRVSGCRLDKQGEA